MDFQLRIAREAAIAKHSSPRINVSSGAFAHPEFGALKEDRLVVGKQYIDIRPQAVIAGLANAVDGQRPSYGFWEDVLFARLSFLQAENAAHTEP